jgi:aryl-alcohol dehydrogenase-like predicted oxidoreductase
MYIDRFWNEENFKAVEQLGSIAKDHGMSLLEMSMRWCVSQEHVDSILTGASRLEQLQQNIELANKGSLGEDVLKRCDDVWEVVSGKRYKYNR